MSKIRPKECQNVEFKTSWNDKYLEWICGFANAQGAVMYFGVNDDHEVVGLKNVKSFIDTWGRGFQKIRDGFEPAGIPMPTVENFCGGVRVTIQRTKFMQMMNVTSDVTSNVSSDVVSSVVSSVGSSVGSLSVVQLSDRQKKIRELILKDTFVSAKQMSVVLSVDSRTVQRDLADLQKKGVLIREGNTSAGHWIWVGTVTDNGNK